MPNPYGPNDPTCPAIRRDGTPCTSQILLPSGYCFTHDPAKEVARAERNATGGTGRSAAARFERLGPPPLRGLTGKLRKGIDDVLAGRLEPAKLTAASTAARALVAVVTAGEAEDRLRELEEAVYGASRSA